MFADNTYEQSNLTAQKVPAITYGRPDVDPDNPAPETPKITESGVLIALFADLSNEELLPKDPVARAHARFFIETVKPLFSGASRGFITREEDPAAIFKPVETIQDLLPADGFAVGPWSIADAAMRPFFARAEVSLKKRGRKGKHEGRKGMPGSW